MTAATKRTCAAVAAVVAILAAPGSASALAPSATVQNNYRNVADLVQRGGATGTIPTPANPTVVDDLWLSEHRPMPNQPSSDALHAELKNLRTKVGVLPKLGAAVGNITLGVASFQVGWMIGTGIRQKFLGLDGAAASATSSGSGYTVTASKMYPVSKGQCAQGAGTAQGATTYPTPLVASSTVIPADGWIAEIASAPYGTLRKAGYNSANGATSRPPEYLFPAGFIPLRRTCTTPSAARAGAPGRAPT